MRHSITLQKMASTHGGMRKILKQRPSTVQFIKWSVETGIHKDLPQPDDRRGGQRHNNNNRNNQRSSNTNPKFQKYPFEYEILTLNPPIPSPPRITKKQQRKNKSSLPTHKLVKSYMRRYDARMKAVTTLTDAEREEYFYRKTLGVPNPATSSTDPSSAMGRKSAVLNHAYEFALKQYETMQKNEGMTEKDSIEVVEELLAKEEKMERLVSREKVQSLVKERQEEVKEATGVKNEEKEESGAGATSAPVKPPSFTIPSILHSKPRTIQALNIWGKRLQAVPYNQWTLGASTALDHWIAVDVLGMSEESWNRLLDGELEIDLEKSRGVDLNIGDMARNRDIVTVRSTLFPETVIHGMDDDLDGSNEDLEGMMDEEKDATERSIDELLASLGGFEEEDVGSSDSSDEDVDSRVSKMIDSLQDWRAKNQEAPFKEWDGDTKKEFNKWLNEYLALVSSEADGTIDIVATRDALLSEPPRYRDESDAFWSQISDETDAEILLHNLAKKDVSPPSGGESTGEKKARESLETFLSMPYSKQLSQVISLGTLRPILDEYCSEEDRVQFMERYGETLLEGMEIEHLVPDPDGNIGVEDVGDRSLLGGQKYGKEQRFSIKMVPYGTDEFGLSRSEKARALYRAWNIQKAGRARYAEQLYKTGKMPLNEGKSV